MSQLLLRIEERLRSEADTYAAAELRAKRAAYFARLGRFQDARDEIAGVRETFSDGRSGRVTALLMLAEGLTLHYEQLTPTAADRVARALLLGQAMRDSEIISLAAAWKAFLDFEASKFDSAFRSISTAIAHVDEKNNSAWTRCCVVLTLGFLLCGDTSSSQYWFLKGRQHALEEGDQVSLDALLHNKAVFGVAWLRVQRCRGIENVQSIARARLELSSTRNLQVLAGVSAHKSYIDLADARLWVLEREFEKALRVLDVISNSGPFPAGHFNQSLVALERAYCLASLGKIVEAGEAIRPYSEEQVAQLDVDDRLASAWMRRELASIDAKFGDMKACQDTLAEVLEEQEQLVARLTALLSQFVHH